MSQSVTVVEHCPTCGAEVPRRIVSAEVVPGCHVHPIEVVWCPSCGQELPW